MRVLLNVSKRQLLKYKQIEVKTPVYIDCKSLILIKVNRLWAKPRVRTAQMSERYN